MNSLTNYTKPFLIIPQTATVQIIRARILRQVLAVLNNPNWSQLVQELPQHVYIRIERSVPLDTHRDDELLKLLSTMEAMLRRYDGLGSLFAQRHAPGGQAISRKEKHASPQTWPGSDHELGSSPERGRLRTRRGDLPQPNHDSPAAKKLPSGGSRNRSTKSNKASPQESTAMSNSKRDFPHANSVVHSTPASQVSAPHMEQTGDAGSGLSQATRNPLIGSKQTVRTEDSRLRQAPLLSSASPLHPARQAQAQPKYSCQSSLGHSR